MKSPVLWGIAIELVIILLTALLVQAIVHQLIALKA